MTSSGDTPHRSRFLDSDAAAGIAVVLIVVGSILVGMASLSAIRNAREGSMACYEHEFPPGALLSEAEIAHGSVWLIPPVLVCQVPLTDGGRTTVYYDIGGWNAVGGAAMLTAGVAFWTLRKRQQARRGNLG